MDQVTADNLWHHLVLKENRQEVTVLHHLARSKTHLQHRETDKLMEKEVNRKKEYLEELFLEIDQKANSESGHKLNGTKNNIDLPLQILPKNAF